MSLKNLKNLLMNAGLLLVIVMAVSSMAFAADEPCEIDATDGQNRPSKDCNPVPTPEPISILLFSAGLAGVGFAARRRLRRAE